jgi:hypothetical protein
VHGLFDLSPTVQQSKGHNNDNHALNHRPMPLLEPVHCCCLGSGLSPPSYFPFCSPDSLHPREPHLSCPAQGCNKKASAIASPPLASVHSTIERILRTLYPEACGSRTSARSSSGFWPFPPNKKSLRGRPSWLGLNDELFEHPLGTSVTTSDSSAFAE